MIAGAGGQFLASPTDLVKVRLQVEGKRVLEGHPPRSVHTPKLTKERQGRVLLPILHLMRDGVYYKCLCSKVIDINTQEVYMHVHVFSFMLATTHACTDVELTISEHD